MSLFLKTSLASAIPRLSLICKFIIIALSRTWPVFGLKRQQKKKKTEQNVANPRLRISILCVLTNNYAIRKSFCVYTYWNSRRFEQRHCMCCVHVSFDDASVGANSRGEAENRKSGATSTELKITKMKKKIIFICILQRYLQKWLPGPA